MSLKFTYDKKQTPKEFVVAAIEKAFPNHKYNHIINWMGHYPKDRKFMCVFHCNDEDMIHAFKDKNIEDVYAEIEESEYTQFIIFDRCNLIEEVL